MISTYNSADVIRKIITITGVFIYLALAVLYGKRTPFLELVIFILSFFYVWANYKHGVRYGRRVFLGKLMIVVSLVIGALLFIKIDSEVGQVVGVSPIDALEQRFLQGEGGQNVKGDSPDGFVEAVAQMVDLVIHGDRLGDKPAEIIAQANGWEIIFGQGMGSTILRMDSMGNLSYAVESGLIQTFFKGGIVFVILLYLGLVAIVFDVLRGKFYTFPAVTILVFMKVVLSPLGPLLINFPVTTGYLLLWLGASASKKMNTHIPGMQSGS